MTDIHRIPADREDMFWNAQRSLNRAPMCAPLGVETENEITYPARLTIRVNRWVVGCVALGAAMFAAFGLGVASWF